MGSGLSTLTTLFSNTINQIPCRPQYRNALKLGSVRQLVSARNQGLADVDLDHAIERISGRLLHHATVDCGDLRSRTFLKLQWQSHPATELIDVLKHFSFSKYPSILQSRAEEEWRRYYKSWMKKSDRSRSPDQMKELIGIFSNLFFAGTLRTVGFAWCKDLWKNHGHLGYCDPNRIKGQRDCAKIVMDPDDVHDGLNHELGIVCTLLHECIHAFTDMYRCSTTCTDEHCQRSLRVVSGYDGHGSLFCCIASHVEVLASRIFERDIVVDFWKMVALRYSKNAELPDDWEISNCDPQHSLLLRQWRDYARSHTFDDDTPSDRSRVAEAFVGGAGSGLLSSYAMRSR